MKKNKLFFAVLSLFLQVPASITWAQTITSQKGLITAVFPTQYGMVKVYLPDDGQPGNIISGTIIAEPKGENSRQIEKNLAELVKFSVSIKGDKFAVTPNLSGFKWLVYQDRQLTIPMELLDVNGYKTGELLLQFKTPGKNKPAQQECVIPPHALTDAACRITGNFDGDASNTKCTLNNQPMQVLAESPGQCQVLYPKKGKGLQTFQITEKGTVKCAGLTSGVDMQVTTGDLDLRKGMNTYIDVKLTGLQNLPDTALLTITNVTPNIVTLTNGNLQVFAIMFTDSAGVWEVHCPAVSIATGNFSVSINFDLPEVQGEHPPTQPQPPENPQPKDSTLPQPPRGDTTVALCPGCKCSCIATISFDAKSGDESTYSVTVTPFCTGGFGTTPPCGSCDMAYTYDWTINSGADRPVTFVGGRNGPVVKISNPLNGSFTLTIVIKVFCGKSICTCEAVERYLATNPVEPPGKCKCKTDCLIKKIESNCDEANFEAVVNAECKGTIPKKKCAVALITYLWFIGEHGKGVAGISGNANGAKVKVKLSGVGNYTLYLKVIVTCSDGTTCESVCSIEETVTECIITHEWCAGPSIKVKAMGYYPADPSLKDNMRPGDLIGLSVYGTDEDVLLQKCINGENVDKTPHPPTPDRVAYLWSINNIRGTSGNIISVAGINSNSILYQIPYCLTNYPVEDRITVTLSNAGDKKDDEEVNIEFTIRLGATIEKYIKDEWGRASALYKVSAVVEGRILNKPADIVCPRFRGCCQALLPATPEEGARLSVTDPIRFTFAKDSFPDNMVLLKADAADNDNLIIKCRTIGGKIITKKIEGIYDDPEYTWEVIKGNARFIYDTGSTVVLIHNYNDGFSPKNDLVIECKVKNRIVSPKEQFIDDSPEPLQEDRSTRKKPIALVGVGDCATTKAINAANLAACKYRRAGYDVIVDMDLDRNEIEKAFKNPATQAAFLIGDGSGGKLITHDKQIISDSDILTWTKEKWGCSGDPVVHPIIMEFHLLGSETGKGKWHDRFFRLEQYFSYEFSHQDCQLGIPWTFNDHAEEFMPRTPRIAPPGNAVYDFKSCCICGPNITEALKTTLDNVIAKYKGLPESTQSNLCESLFKPTTLGMAWDINELKWSTGSICLAPCCNPNSPCYPSVQVGVECFGASAVNYIVYGVMCKLCGIPPETMLTSVQLWKGPGLSLVAITQQLLKGKMPKGADNYEYSALFAVVGYNYNTDGLKIFFPGDPQYPCEAICPTPNPYSQFRVNWGGKEKIFIPAIKK